MSDWTDSDSEKENDDFQPPKKHQKVPASLKGKQRFTEMVSSEQLETISKGFVPKNTEKNMKWAVSTFKHETSVALWARLEMSTSSQSQWTKTVNTLNFAVFCVFLLLKPAKPTVTRIHTSSTTRNTSVVPSALFGSA